MLVTVQIVVSRIPLCSISTGSTWRWSEERISDSKRNLHAYRFITDILDHRYCSTETRKSGADFVCFLRADQKKYTRTERATFLELKVMKRACLLAMVTPAAANHLYHVSNFFSILKIWGVE